MEELPTRNGKHCKRAVQASRSLKQKARLRKESGLCFATRRIIVILDLKLDSRSIYLGFLAGFCLLGFRGTTSRDTITSFVGLRSRFVFGFFMPISWQSRRDLR